MLILSRRLNDEPLVLELAADVDPNTPIGEVFGHNGVRLYVRQVKGTSVRLGIDAPQAIACRRGELEPWNGGTKASGLTAENRKGGPTVQWRRRRTLHTS